MGCFGEQLRFCFRRWCFFNPRPREGETQLRRNPIMVPRDDDFVDSASVTAPRPIHTAERRSRCEQGFAALSRWSARRHHRHRSVASTHTRLSRDHRSRNLSAGLGSRATSFSTSFRVSAFLTVPSNCSFSTSRRPARLPLRCAEKSASATPAAVRINPQVRAPIDRRKAKIHGIIP